MAKKHGLGRGLSALIRDDETTGGDTPQAAGIRDVPVDDIRRSNWQPRREFEQEALNELAESIRRHGVLQPLLVRQAEDGYELIAGERRLRASLAAGVESVPAIVLEAADRDALELALTENLQREDLNIIEEAQGYQLLADRFELTQEAIAERVGKGRATVANAMRLLALPDEVRRLVSDNKLSAGHAKVLTALDAPQEQSALARRVAQEGMSVRELEKAIERKRRGPRKPRPSQTDLPQQHLSYLSDRLHGHFGTSVRITPSRTYANGKKARGSIEIDFYSNEELDRILELLGLRED